MVHDRGVPVPSLILLIIKGLSKMIAGDKTCGDIKGIKVTKNSFYSHLLFIDDVLIFGDGTIEEWRAYNYFFYVF